MPADLLPRLAQAVRWVPRHNLLAAVAAVFLLLCGLGLTAAYRFSPEARLQEAESGLQRGQAQILIGDRSKPAWFEVLTGKPVCASSGGADGVFAVHTWGETLIELIQHPRRDHYRFRAQVRQNKSAKWGRVGIYVARHEHASATTVHEFVATTYYDLRDDREDFDMQLWRADFRSVPVPPPRPLGNAVSLMPHVLAETEPRPVSMAFGGPSRVFTPMTPPPWRRISLEVSPEGVLGYWADDVSGRLASIGSLSIREIANRTKLGLNAARNQPDSNPCLQGWEPSYSPQGGLGLLVDQGSASFRHVVVEPLP